jgi:hypothetical protein
MSDGTHIWGQTGRFRLGLFAERGLIYVLEDDRVAFYQGVTVTSSTSLQLSGLSGLAGTLNGMHCRSFVCICCNGRRPGTDQCCRHRNLSDSLSR